MTNIRKEVVYGFADQALLSLTNFLLGIFLVKHVTKEEYGLYVIGNAIVLFIVGLANGLITTQMTVLAPSKSDSNRDGYCAGMLQAQNIILIPVLLISLCLLYFLDQYAGISWFSLGVAISLALPGILLIEFLRRYFYLKLRPATVLSMDVIYILAVFAVLFLATVTIPKNLHIIIFIILGFVALACGIGAMATIRFPLRTACDITISSLREAWQQGKWALGGVIVTTMQSQAYVYILGALAGPARVAEANAAYLFLAPLSMLSTSFGRVFMPHMAILRSQGENRRVESLANKLLLLLVVATVGYATVIIIAKEWLIGLLLTKHYQDIGMFIVIWSVVFLFMAWRTNLSILLQIYSRFSIITKVNTASAIAVLVATYILTKKYDVIGSLVSLAGGELLLGYFLWKAFNNVKKPFKVSRTYPSEIDL